MEQIRDLPANNGGRMRETLIKAIGEASAIGRTEVCVCAPRKACTLGFVAARSQIGKLSVRGARVVVKSPSLSFSAEASPCQSGGALLRRCACFQNHGSESPLGGLKSHER